MTVFSLILRKLRDKALHVHGSQLLGLKLNYGSIKDLSP